jgi:putative heme-binding domain-containing protein
MVAYVKQLSRQGASDPVTGNAAAGGALYRKHGCAQCHTIGGEGGHLGPDLTEAGVKRAVRHLRESLVNPHADIPIEFRTVTVSPVTGPAVSGIHLNEDEYSVHLRDTAGNLRSFLKKEVKEVKLPNQSLMPAYGGLAKIDIEDLVAYLVGLGSRR